MANTPVKAVGIPPGTKFVRLDRDEHNKRWIVWIDSDAMCTQGTYLALHDNGDLTREYLHPAGYEEVLLTIMKGQTDDKAKS